jgi:aryl-phospho-beta-D-glucosidase BglC (GH1 family)
MLLSSLTTYSVTPVPDARDSLRFGSDGDTEVTPTLQVSHRDVKLANGTSVLLRGCSLYGPDIDYNIPTRGGEWERIKESYFDYVKSWGLNFVRLCISWDLLQPNFSGSLDPVYLARMDQTVQWCEQRGLYISIDLHYKNHYGSGLPEWGNDFWYPYGENSPALKNSWIDLWKELTKHYKGESAIAFFGLCNEPHLSLSENSLSSDFINAWMTMATDASLAIHQIDPTRIVGIDPPGWSHAENMRFVEPIPDPDPNIVYTPHYYWTGCPGGPNVTYSDSGQIWSGAFPGRQSYIGPAIDWMNQNDKALVFTEFGFIMKGRTDLTQMLGDLLNFFDRYNVGWAYWAFWVGGEIYYGLLDDVGWTGVGFQTPMVSILHEHVTSTHRSQSVTIYNMGQIS